MKEMTLVTGGAGYIGSHIVLSLLESGTDVVVLDNLSNSSVESIYQVEKICGRRPEFFEGDVRDHEVLDRIFRKYRVGSVIHCAGLKAVSESVADPLRYFLNNVSGTLELCAAMARHNIFRLVFSSSATVYGDALSMPVDEACPTTSPANPYGRSKLMVEEILKDLVGSNDRWKIAIARYFNPIGAHFSGLIGEDPTGVPNNLLPYISQVAIGKLKVLSVFGGDYPTLDGTAIRDYIHVVDLAKGHLMALRAINSMAGLNVWNFGSGKGYSVLELVSAFEKASGVTVPYQIVPRRSGDIAACWASVKKADLELKWRAERDLHQMMVDAWRWQLNNPDGYRR